VHFWVVDMVGHARQDGDGDPAIYMLPAPFEHMDIEQHGDSIPDNVLQYCKTAQDIYFSGNLMATNVLIKTAMETIFDDFLPMGNSRTELSMMIRDSISTINHSEPLTRLSASTKKNGDLHELFKKHHGTTHDTADAMMHMLETLIMYLYILPSRFKEIEARLAELKVSADATDDKTTSRANDRKTDTSEGEQPSGYDHLDDDDDQVKDAA